jgi:LuxR family maltose regulon positive regulatory protein
VARQRLIDRLDALWPAPLVLISAPAGFGKTTLVGQWAASRAARGLPPHVAWLALDADDNDPIRFWRYIIAACQAIKADLGQPALAILDDPGHAPFAPPPLEHAITALLNDLAGLSRPALLVLEDLHLIGDLRTLASLEFMLAHLPATTHLIWITRGDPPFSLSQLRARGGLAELRAADLRFSPAELRDFLALALPAPLPDAVIQRLEARAEGWAAGLRLAALAAQGQAAPEAAAQALEQFHGDQGPVADYLATAVLDAQPEATQRFLLQTSILPRLSGPLCDAITGRDDSAELLAQLEQAHLFLSSLGSAPGWYRYHALFGEAMLQAARRRLPAAELRACHERASAWYGIHALLDDAVDAALAAGAWERAAELIERIVAARPSADPNEPARLRAWLEQLPQALLHGHPALCFSYGMALLRTSGRPVSTIAGTLAELAAIAEAGWRRQGRLERVGELYAAQALFSLWQGSLDMAVSWSRRALELLPASDISWRGIALGFLGKSLVDAGRLDEARKTLAEAHGLTTASWTRPGARAHAIMLGNVAAAQNDPHHAAALYQQALDDALDAGDRQDVGLARLGLARLAYERNDLAAAAAGAQAASELGAAGAAPQLQVQGALLLARVLQARGEAQAAQEQVAAALTAASPRPPLLHRSALAAQARLQLDAGDLPAVEQWAAASAALGPAPGRLLEEEEALLVVRLQLAQGGVGGALRELAHWYEAARADGRRRSALEIQLLLAMALLARGELVAAAEALHATLAPSRASGYRRLFLDEGAAMASLLRTLGPQVREPALRAYLQLLVRAFAQEQLGRDEAPALSRQERRVLALLAEGSSNDEIAQALVVSPNTVKTQLRQVYRKLGASSREEARRIARELALIP